MRMNKKFDVSVFSDLQRFNRPLGQELEYREMKVVLINFMKNEQYTQSCFGKDYFIYISSGKSVIQVINYTYLRAQFGYDEPPYKAFGFLIDCLLLYAEWTNTRQMPRKLIEEVTKDLTKRERK